MAGHKFRRQHPIDKYIVDFACLEKKIIVELDGSQHVDSNDYEKEKTSFLESKGFEILRFWNSEVFNETDAVIEKIYNLIIQNNPLPRPPWMGEGEQVNYYHGR
jgi:very-short-patch-repair endonuclease